MSRRAAYVPAAFALVCAAILPRLADRGMFLDGVTYAAIARNLAAGEGSVWHPHYTRTVYPDFHEQPPLGLAIQSLAFGIGGDHLLVERLYSFLIAVASAALIVWLWRTAHGITRADLAWIPVVFWISAPVVSWAFVNNMLEGTQGIFTLLAAGAALRGVIGRGGGVSSAAWGGLSGAAMAAALLSKGPVGLFPLAVPWAFMLTAGMSRPGPRAAALASPRGAAAVSLAQVVVLVVAGWACWSYAPAREGLQSYLRQQVRPTLSGERETSASRLRFAKTLAQELLPMGVLTAALLIVSRKRLATTSGAEPAAVATGFLLVAVAASVPLVVSPKQSGHYVVPSIPMYALAFGSLAARAGELVPASDQAVRAVRWSSAVLVAVSVAILAMAWGMTVRDAVILRDFDRVFARVPSGTTLGLCPEAAAEWGLHAYAQRLWRASLDAAPRTHRWHLVVPLAGCAAPEGCRRHVLGTERLQLFECSPGPVE